MLAAAVQSHRAMRICDYPALSSHMRHMPRILLKQVERFQRLSSGDV